jgi:hypothetical protein
MNNIVFFVLIRILKCFPICEETVGFTKILKEKNGPGIGAPLATPHIRKLMMLSVE